MATEFSKAALNTFLTSTAGNLFNPHTASGYRAAIARIFEHIADDADVRSIDLATEVRRYNNAHPGELSPSTLGQYQRRLEVAIEEFVKFTNDPGKYKGRGRSRVEGGSAKRAEGANTKIAPPAGAAHIAAGSVGNVRLPTPGLSYEFPLRKDFLAQIVVPRDMNGDEARRLCRFVMALAHDESADPSLPSPE